MKDPHDIRKAAIEDEIIARSEEASSKLSCFKCGDGYTPLYCLNCANGELRAVIEQCEVCLWSIVGDRTKEHFKGNGPGSIAGEFDVKDLHMALDALAAIKQVKEGK